MDKMACEHSEKRIKLCGDDSVMHAKTRLIVHEESENDLCDEDIASDSTLHSAMQARLMLQWMLGPLQVDEFYAKYWGKRPVVIKRKKQAFYNNCWFDEREMIRILEDHSLEYINDVDVARYIDGTRETWLPEKSGIASGKDVWTKYAEGWSIRLLCPQQYSDRLWRLLSILESEFGTMMGANTYLTPPRAQGFAPHYDDIEAFILQLEGRKQWKVYSPRCTEQILPRVSSKNFQQDDIGDPLLEVELGPGDLLYLPRGYIHQAKTAKELHSLHITISAGQHNAYADLMEVLIPQALQSAIQSNLSMRKSLPRNYLSYMGVMHSDLDEHAERQKFISETKKQLKAIMTEAVAKLDAASDQMAKRFLMDRLPPALLDEEEDCSVEACPLLKITVDTQFKLLRGEIARLVIEEDKAVVYHCKDNSRKHHENPISPLEFEIDDAECIEFILKSYPSAFRVGDLPHEDSDDQIGVAKALYDEGILCFVKFDACNEAA
uniref:Bifunctional lysine-specific demethylase and histidyl-hydroxylase n=1 Tax=Albugo laibachii Nc14 TaxID=890382 RepID=F0WNK1_9STRA|nr:nucleolar protein putative [Albugo laibachii Nc14]|eukprot:CCA22892.1 nucleolar protein putative [Albugo laibachii Nc14]